MAWKTTDWAWREVSSLFKTAESHHLNGMCQALTIPRGVHGRSTCASYQGPGPLATVVALHSIPGLPKCVPAPAQMHCATRKQGFTSILGRDLTLPSLENILAALLI